MSLKADERPDATVFTSAVSRRGYKLNKFAMSLIDPANRKAFLADEVGTMRAWGLGDTEIDAVRRRDWAGLMACGGNVYLVLKIVGTVGQTLLHMGAQMRGEPLETMTARMNARATGPTPGTGAR